MFHHGRQLCKYMSTFQTKEKQNRAMQCSAIPSHPIQSNSKTIQCNAIPCHAMPCHTIRYDTIRHDTHTHTHTHTIQYNNSKRCNTPEFSTVQCSPLLRFPKGAFQRQRIRDGRSYDFIT